MQGTNAITGELLSGNAHLQQSIRDILTTPLGTRVMRPEYGSRLFELIDQPWGENLKLELYAATAEALATYEPRLILDRVQADTLPTGHVLLKISSKIIDSNDVNNEILIKTDIML